jgi:adenylate kinase
MKTFKIIVLASANGSGKGTFGRYLSQMDPKFIHIDAGNIVRSEIKNQTDVGKKIQPIYESCKYLDESIDEIIWHELIKNKITKGLEKNKTIIIDGCLRSNTTFNLLDKFIKSNNLTADT